MRFGILADLVLTGAAALSEDKAELPSRGTALAVEIAQAIVADCAVDDYAFAAAVTERSGILLSLGCAENAGRHTSNATAKAHLGIVTKSDQRYGQDCAGQSRRGGGVDNPDFLMLAGAAPIKSGDVTIGALGVVGAPDGNPDEVCAIRAPDVFSDRG